jgi:hypothetical protein
LDGLSIAADIMILLATLSGVCATKEVDDPNNNAENIARLKNIIFLLSMTKYHEFSSRYNHLHLASNALGNNHGDHIDTACR